MRPLLIRIKKKEKKWEVLVSSASRECTYSINGTFQRSAAVSDAVWDFSQESKKCQITSDKN